MIDSRRSRARAPDSVPVFAWIIFGQLIGPYCSVSLSGSVNGMTATARNMYLCLMILTPLTMVVDVDIERVGTDCVPSKNTDPCEELHHSIYSTNAHNTTGPVWGVKERSQVKYNMQ